MRPLFSKRAALLTTTLRGRSFAYKKELTQSFEARCIPEFESGKLKVLVDKEFKMTEIREAMKVVEDNQATGKIVILNDL